MDARLTVRLAASRVRRAKELLRLRALKQAAAILVGSRGLDLGLTGAARTTRGRLGNAGRRQGGLNLSNVSADMLMELAGGQTMRFGAAGNGRVCFVIVPIRPGP